MLLRNNIILPHFNIYMCDSILEFEQSWNFFRQLYNYSKKMTLLDPTKYIYL